MPTLINELATNEIANPRSKIIQKRLQPKTLTNVIQDTNMFAVIASFMNDNDAFMFCMTNRYAHVTMHKLGEPLSRSQLTCFQGNAKYLSNLQKELDECEKPRSRILYEYIGQNLYHAPRFLKSQFVECKKPAVSDDWIHYILESRLLQQLLVKQYCNLKETDCKHIGYFAVFPWINDARITRRWFKHAVETHDLGFMRYINENANLSDECLVTSILADLVEFGNENILQTFLKKIKNAFIQNFVQFNDCKILKAHNLNIFFAFAEYFDNPFTIWDKNMESILHKLAVDDNNADLAQALFDLAEKKQLKDSFLISPGRSALHVAIKAKQTKMITVFLSNGLDPDESDYDNEGKTALHVAVEQTDTRMLEELLKYTNFVNATDHYGDTALSHLCMFPGRQQHAKLLLDAGADIMITNYARETTFDVALDQCCDDLCAIFLEHRRFIPPVYAVEDALKNKMFKTAKFLIENIHVKEEWRITDYLQTAIEQAMFAHVEILLQKYPQVQTKNLGNTSDVFTAKELMSKLYPDHHLTAQLTHSYEKMENVREFTNGRVHIVDHLKQTK